VYKEHFTPTYTTTEVFAPLMLSAQIDDATKLGDFGVIVFKTFSDAYLLKHADARFVALQSDRANRPENSLLEDFWSIPEYRRGKAVFTANETEYSHTSRIQYVQITPKNVSKIRLNVRPWLRGLLNQPPLTLLPLLSNFSNTVGDSTDERLWADAPSFTCTESPVGQLDNPPIGLKYDPLIQLRVNKVGSVATTQYQLSSR
jgi:hypothetical protein